MTYFKQLKKFLVTYKVGSLDTLKLIVLYPIFKFHFWYVYGSGVRKQISRVVFSFFSKKLFFTIRLYQPAIDAYLAVPIWLKPDRLSSFHEIFWDHAYRLKPEWAPTMLIDAGANAGYVCLYLAGQTGVKKILAIEANSDLWDGLNWAAHMLAEHGIEMHVAKGAVVGKPRNLVFEVMSSDRDSRVADLHLAGKASNVITVKGQKLGDWIYEAGFMNAVAQRGVLLKADIEGSEYEMMEAQPDLMDAFDYLVMEVHGKSELRDQLAQKIAKNHLVLNRDFNPSYPDVEVLYSQHQGKIK